MKKLAPAAFCFLVIIGVAVSLWEQHQYRSRLRESDQLLRQYVARLDQLTAENERMSNLLARIKGPDSLTGDQQSELLKLRSKVNELLRQQRENEKMRSVPPDRETKPAATATVPPATSETQGIPKESWAFVGYQTPQNALQSVMWAMNAGDLRTFLASLAPEAQDAVTARFEGKSDNEIAALLKEEVSHIGALRLDRMRQSSETEASFEVSSTETDNGKVKTRDAAVLNFRNIGGAWKLTDF
ncbi:MAG TPA: hypothetical protein VH598_10180 [Verrucomicrobiae bacterium]|nr:hypothetical protein [Verrucomicrobiae bacterium]